VIAALDKARGANSIDLRINSAGGDVFEGVAIYEALTRFPGRIVAHVDGLAASAASFIAMAADEIAVAPMAYIMIHEAHGGVLGRAEDMRAQAELLDKISQTIAASYVARSKLTETEALDLMGEETWFTAEQAVAVGLADRLADRPKAMPQARMKAAACFRNAPDAVLAMLAASSAKAMRPAAKAPTTDHRAIYLEQARMRARVRALAR
jgi:ATP-dependent Clp protease protease subunit